MIGVVLVWVLAVLWCVENKKNALNETHHRGVKVSDQQRLRLETRVTTQIMLGEAATVTMILIWLI